jgi:hypothetical protein
MELKRVELVTITYHQARDKKGPRSKL